MFDSYALTKQVAVNMFHIVPEDAVCGDHLNQTCCGDHLNQTCSKESVDELLKCFSPGLMRLDFCTTFDDFGRMNTDINSLAKVCVQIGTEKIDAQNTAVLHLFHSMIENNLIYWLRMKNNLRYEIGSELQFQYGMKLLSIYVVSSVHNPEYLLDQIYIYLSGLEHFLEGMEDDEFETHKNSICDEYPDDGGEDLWDQITEKKRFDSNKRVQRILRKISKDDVVNFYKMYLVKTSPMLGCFP